MVDQRLFYIVHVTMNEKVVMMEDWKKLISVANVFNGSTKILDAVSDGLSKQKSKDAIDISLHTLIPSIVLKAFACEMYLKTYIANQGGTVPKTHDLYELFRNINKVTRAKISKLLIQMCLQSVDPEYNLDKLDNDIKKISLAFEEWRYFYEKSNTIDIQFLNIFLKALTDPSITPPHH